MCALSSSRFLPLLGLYSSDCQVFPHLLSQAGSSGCRAHVFRYGVLGHDSGPLYILPKHDSLKVKPGLSSFKTSPSQAGASLEGLITFLKSKVPISQWASTPIYLKATAGLRLVTDTERQAILSSVRQYLGDKTVSPFAFHPSDAKVISGIEEGAVSDVGKF